ncbi:nuclear transport factor 2 family protein [Streptomyces sp. NPDC001380]|uniref:nuclear transport factor 2 family protein n=1 Tax=Streptomyces sp. NPDC001380 TaxID=3364566 RepID=UPI0036BBA4C4
MSGHGPAGTSGAGPAGSSAPPPRPARPREIRDVVVHGGADPEVLVVEQAVAGTLEPDGRPFAFPGVLVLRVRGGLLVHVRDCLDALGAAHALGRLQAVAAALDGAS